MCVNVLSVKRDLEHPYTPSCIYMYMCTLITRDKCLQRKQHDTMQGSIEKYYVLVTLWADLDEKTLSQATYLPQA